MDKKIIEKLIVVGTLSACCSVGLAVIITGHLWDVANIKSNLQNLRVWTTINRAYILSLLFVFIGIHFVFPINKMYNWMFKRRWFIGLLLLAFVTLNRWHGDSISCYDNIIQPGISSEPSRPIWGHERAIRSDEYVVTTPSILASQYGEEAYGKYNHIMRGTDTLNIISGIYGGCATVIYAPWELIYLILPFEFAYSFCWYAVFVLGFLMMLELFYIISHQQKLVALASTFLVMFSSFYLWWGFSSYYFSAPGTVVCIYYFLNSDKLWKKILLGLGTALCFGNFIVNLYPAWQVPLGYMFLVIGIYVLHENWDKVKGLKIRDWLILFSCLLLMIGLVTVYFFSISEYVEIIKGTVYPGKRSENGSFSLNKLFYYAQAPFYAYKDIGNPCEAGVFFSLFPVPTILAGYYWIREKKKDWLTGGLLLIQIPMLIYITIGMPELISKLLLFSHSTSNRMTDIIGLMQIFLILKLLSRYDKAKKAPFVLAVLVGFATAGVSIYVSNQYYPGYLTVIEKIITLGVIVFIVSGLMIESTRRIKKIILFAFISVSIVTGIYVRPIMKGFDAIFAKPVAHEIAEICKQDQEAKWITQGLGLILPGYSVACGATTVNSVNIYPNLELWEKLDQEKQYEEIYNRYAHIDIEFTSKNTFFEKIHGDHISVNLSYRDIKKTGATYLLIVGKLNADVNNGYVEFEKVYDEAGISIYKMNY